MQRLKKIIPYIIAAILLVIGIIGYMSKDTGSPVRVLFKTKGGNVVFTHKSHISKYKISCDKCHHEMKKSDYNCRNCHAKGTSYDGFCTKQAIHKQCIGANCIGCHKKTMGMEEKNCKYCHK